MFFLAGCYLGLVVDAKQFRGTIRGVNQTNIRKSLFRVVLSALAIVPIFVCPVYLISSSRFVFAVLMVKYAIPSFIIGFILFGHSKTIYERFNLINEEEISLELENSLNMGQIEDVEEEKEFSGKKRSQMYEDGLQ